MDSMSNIEQLLSFFDQVDENGVSNEDKTKGAQVIRRLESTAKSKSYENSDMPQHTGSNDLPLGIVTDNGKLIGFGIHILNEDVYPLKSFEIYLRGIDLVGKLDLSDCEDLVFVDVYRNRIDEVNIRNTPALRILGLQDNRLSRLDPSGSPTCQGIDVGKNALADIDVSSNPELVELYVNDNELSAIDVSRNPRLKYLYCHNNRIRELDTRGNELLRHLNATGNPMTDIWSLAPQRDGKLPLELHAGEGGHVGLRFNPIYDAQWKETGEWEQVYFAYPLPGHSFAGWFEDAGKLQGSNPELVDEYGATRILTARFCEQPRERS